MLLWLRRFVVDLPWLGDVLRAPGACFEGFPAVAGPLSFLSCGSSGAGGKGSPCSCGSGALLLTCLGLATFCALLPPNARRAFFSQLCHYGAPPQAAPRSISKSPPQAEKFFFGDFSRGGSSGAPLLLWPVWLGLAWLGLARLVGLPCLALPWLPCLGLPCLGPCNAIAGRRTRATVKPEQGSKSAPRSCLLK